MPESTMKAAMKAAGIFAPEERLADIAKLVLDEKHRTRDSARLSFWHHVNYDPALLWAAFAHWHNMGADQYLEAAVRSRAVERAAREKRQGPGAAPNGKTRGSGRASEPSAAQRMAARNSVVVLLSRLDTFKVNEQPIGDLTPEAALAARTAKLRDARFIELVVAGVPPGRPIRDYVRGDEADALFERATEEAGNA